MDRPADKAESDRVTTNHPGLVVKPIDEIKKEVFMTFSLLFFISMLYSITHFIIKKKEIIF
jgi:hypothetical protein